MNSEIKYRKNGKRHGYSHDYPEWEILYKGTKVGTCHRRPEGSAGYFGAWTVTGVGHRDCWTDSRSSCGHMLTRLVANHLAVLEHYDECIRYMTTAQHEQAIYRSMTRLGLCQSTEGMDDHDEHIMYVWPA